MPASRPPARPAASPRLPSSLGRHVAATPTSAEDLERLRAAAWHRQGALSVRVDEVEDDWLRQALINLGTRCYGARAAGEGARGERGRK